MEQADPGDAGPADAKGSFLEEIRRRLDALRSDGLRRELILPEGVDFSSNDYLGLSRHPRLRATLLESLRSGPLTAPASRLLRGNTREHEDLERRLAEFKGTESALLFPSGYQANLAVLTTLLKRDDLVLFDEQNHASLHDGLRLSGCGKQSFPHLDADALCRLLEKRPRRGRVFVLTESLFSMDGDVAPLDRYADLAESCGANLIVDDAHATGLYGDARSSGLTERFGVARRTVATVSTCGKALGVCGAFFAGPSVVRDYLVNRSRPFIFSTAPAHLLLYAIDAALEIVRAEPDRKRRALELADRLRSALVSRGLDCLRSEGPIVPVILGHSDKALRVANSVRARGFDVRAVRPPAVAPRTSRLRISVHADHSLEEIDGLTDAITDAVKSVEPTAGGEP